MVFCFRKQTALLAGLTANRSIVSGPFLGTETARWGSEHLVDYERSEIIYLVIRDHKNEPELKL